MPALKLRQDIVRSIPYRGPGGKHQCVYWDEALECFGLRVYPSGRRVYVCAYRVNRRKRMARLGRADVLTLDQARKKAMAYLGRCQGSCRINGFSYAAFFNWISAVLFASPLLSI